MKRDPLLFQLFRDIPASFFYLVGRPGADAGRYTFDAVEYKTTAVRLDGLFRPRGPDAGPAYLWEAQFQPSDRVYANLWTKVGLFLQNEDPAQDWVAVVIYPTRVLEQTNLQPYRCLIESEQLIRIYLDELPPAPPDQFGLGLLQLIGAKPEGALERARAMIPRVRAADLPGEVRDRLLQFIETVIVFQFPEWTREEIGKMIQSFDITQTRVFQEGLEEGLEKGRKETAAARAEVTEEIARRLLGMGHSVAEVATATGLTAAKVRKLAKKK